MVRARLRAQSIAKSRWRGARWLVIAPHADDETLGAGALIAQAAAEGRLEGVAFLTDGAGSHPCPGSASRAGLKAARKAEANVALRRLGARGAGRFLGWPDAHPAVPGSPRFEGTRRKLVGICRQGGVDAIAVTAEHEPHCDHAAASALARAVATTALRPIAVFEYIVWGEPPAQTRHAFLTKPVRPGIRRSALAAHRSQLTPLFGAGFRLSADQMRMADMDRLYLCQVSRDR